MNTQPQAHAANTDDAVLASLLGELGEDEVIESSHEPEAIEAAVADLEKAEANQAVYADENHQEAEVADADKPSTDAVSEKPAKKAKKAAAPKEPKEPKAPRITSITHKPGDRLVAMLGGKDWLQFVTTDDDATRISRADSFIEAMNSKDAIADKVREKAIMLMTWLASGKDKSALNEVLLRAFETLFRDGELTSGKDGNLQVNLLSKPYSPGTAASQANQMFMLFPLLLVTQREKGKMVANPDSAIVQAMKIKLAA